jgi:hypothetical protein
MHTLTCLKQAHRNVFDKYLHCQVEKNQITHDNIINVSVKIRMCECES